MARPFGTIEKMTGSNRYRARYRHHDYPGKRFNAPMTFRTKGEARAYLATVEADIARGVWKHPDQVAADAEAARVAATIESVTVADWAQTWYDDRKHEWASGTLHTRKSVLKLHILPVLGSTRLVDLKPRDIDRWYDDLPSDGVRTPAYRTLKGMLNAAVESDETALMENPCRVRGGGIQRQVRGERRLLTSEEIDRITAAIRSELKALVILLADAGLRINEALALRRRNVQLGDLGGEVVIAHSLTRGETGGLELGPTKTRRTRTVQLRPATVEALREHMGVFTGDGLDSPVFPSFTGRRRFMQSAQVGVEFGKAVEQAGITLGGGQFLGLHALRHYSATTYGALGATVADLMDRYGWSSADMAARYQHATKARQRALLESEQAGGNVVSLDERRRMA
ncbi:hypothetical protein DRB06_13415 [Actinomyces sp. Z5]|uniref:tyrosine-type recombinase/integrase n=1 Tax=Actinomyces sp. Z5 TaxID=2250216 RepID=UPI000DCBC57A|nr:site-specific integrase [Actinomyces sp. Z5]RAX19465.1 hypothetical protein DRB06_13415 [Actinomyces sp. Z5]